MSWIVTGTQKYHAAVDPDARAYIQAVEAADSQYLETAVASAIDTFVIGCKADGIWSAIKASCILAGARTLNGALVPLVGAAPTNVDGLFVSDDYDRKTGLVGDGSTKYLNSNRNNNADPQDSKHVSVYATSLATNQPTVAVTYIGQPTIGSGASHLSRVANNTFIASRLNSSTFFNSTILNQATGLISLNRSESASYTSRSGGLIQTVNVSSATPSSQDLLVFNGINIANARLAFYSIGESLDLALLDARVTALVNAFDAAI
jgi:hypothetical protein